MVELFPQNADESSPLIIFMHGMGGRPDHFVDHWRNFPKRAHVALPRAFDPFGDGFSWFEFKDGMTDEHFGAAVSASEERLWKGIAKLAGARRPIVSGFSQGGILSFAIASRHPDVVSRAFPVAGSCPGPLLPKNKSRAAPLLAFHGTEDNVLQIKWGREAVNAFKEQGNEAEMKEYAGVGHTMTSEMKKDLWDAIAKAL
jgi:phospholipase/carboxylesterase